MLAVDKLPVLIVVTERNGAYTTPTVAGMRASSTSSAEVAVGRLVDKLSTKLALAPGALRGEPRVWLDEQPGQSLWCIQISEGKS